MFNVLFFTNNMIQYILDAVLKYLKEIPKYLCYLWLY